MSNIYGRRLLSLIRRVRGEIRAGPLIRKTATYLHCKNVFPRYCAGLIIIKHWVSTTSEIPFYDDCRELKLTTVVEMVIIIVLFKHRAIAHGYYCSMVIVYRMVTVFDGIQIFFCLSLPTWLEEDLWKSIKRQSSF